MINQLISERNLALKLAMFGFPLRIFVCAFLHSKIVEGIDVEPAQLDLAFFGHTSGHIGDLFFASKLGSAMQIALNKIRNDSSLLGRMNISTHFADTLCSPKVGLDLIVNLSQRYDINALIGPACPRTTEVVGLFTSQRNIPTIGYSYSNDKLADKAVYDIMVTTKARGDADAIPISHIMDRINWTLVCVYTPSPFHLHHWISAYDRLQDLFSERKITLLKEVVFTWNWPPKKSEYVETLQHIKRTCRGKHSATFITDRIRIVRGKLDLICSVMSVCQSIVSWEKEGGFSM